MEHAPSDWLDLNRANWNERVSFHLNSPSYDLDSLRSGCGALYPIEERELGSVEGSHLLHLQCHFGRDTLSLAQRGARVVGVDFSETAIAAANQLAREVRLSEMSLFIECDVYDTTALDQRPASFDIVYVTWGALNWLPDIPRWASIVAYFLKPGGFLYLAEGHPSAFLLSLMLGWQAAPSLSAQAYDGPIVLDDHRDYADDAAVLTNRRVVEWAHPLGKIVTALIQAGLVVEWLHEHDCVPWRQIKRLILGSDRMYRWPGQALLPLSYSLRARRA